MQSLLSDLSQSTVSIENYGITINELDGRFLYANQAYQEIVGYSEEELLAMTYMDITHPDDIEANVKLDQDIISTDTMPFFEMHKRYIHKKQHIIDILLKVGVIKGVGDQSDRYIAFILDKKLLEDHESTVSKNRGFIDTLGEPWNHLLTSFELVHKYKEKSKRKSTHLANTVHELRTPLNAIKACGEFLNSSLEDGRSANNSEYLKYISNGCRDLEQTISQILDYEMIELGRFTISKSEFVLNDLLVDVTNNLQTYSKQHGLDLSLVHDASSPIKINADQTRLRSVFNNLISNGIKYTEKGSVTVNLELKGDQVEVTVKDTGVGISEEDQSILFDESKKVNVDIDKHVDSIGLGLVIANKIVESHGGSIKVKSAIKKGSTFTVVLPLS